MAEHKPNLSHDVVSDSLAQQRFTPADLWAVVKVQVDDVETTAIIVDDSVQAKRYSYFIELVKKQYSGNAPSTVKDVGLVDFIHSVGGDGEFWPIDYRIYHPDTDGKLKKNHFQPGRRCGNVSAAHDLQATARATPSKLGGFSLIAAVPRRDMPPWTTLS